MTAAEASGTSSAAKISETRSALVRAATAAVRSDVAEAANVEVVKLINSQVAGPVTISDVTVYSTPTHAITEALLKAEEERESAEKDETVWRRLKFLSVAAFVDQFRLVAGLAVDGSDVPDMLEFLGDFRGWQMKSGNPNWTEIVEILTLLGAFERIYGQHLQLLDLKRRDEEGQPFSTPIQLYRRRADLVGTNADRGYFKKAAGHLDEAMKLARERLGTTAIEIPHLLFETALLQRDRGEYRSAAKTLNALLIELMQNHSSEKRWIAAAYKTLAIVERDHHRNFAATFHLWAADTFEEASELEGTQTKALRKQQRKHLIAYLGFQLLLTLPIYLILGFMTGNAALQLVATGALTSIFYPYYLAFFDGLFGIFVAWWVGQVSNKWPVASPMEAYLLDVAASQFRTLKFNR